MSFCNTFFQKARRGKFPYSEGNKNPTKEYRDSVGRNDALNIKDQIKRSLENVMILTHKLSVCEENAANMTCAKVNLKKLMPSKM